MCVHYLKSPACTNISWSWSVADLVDSAGIASQWQCYQMNTSTHKYKYSQISPPCTVHVRELPQKSCKCTYFILNSLEHFWPGAFVLLGFIHKLLLQLPETIGRPAYMCLVFCPLPLVSHELPLVTSISELGGGSSGKIWAAETWRDSRAYSYKLLYRGLVLKFPLWEENPPR